MRYQIYHKTIYSYNQPVILKPHVLRLYPRADAGQKLLDFSLFIEPKPQNISHVTDLDGNYCLHLWFTQPAEKLTIEVTSAIETLQSNPFNYLLEPWALKLPIDYPNSLLIQLQPYLQPYSIAPDFVAQQLAQEILHQVESDTISFVSTVNQEIYQNCQYLTREIGQPWPAGITWTNKQGSCRDFVVLFMEVCRAVGLASRFVSGYQEGDPDQELLDLHAWVEVYLPGAGWKGYDPTHGLAVSDRHIALAASAKPSYCAPIVGTAAPIIPIIQSQQLLQSEMEAHIRIKML
jgi:transglutaminase-like putative cysteine protease